MHARWHTADSTIRSSLAVRRDVADILLRTSYFLFHPFSAHHDLAG